jgi:hypothetical protein
MMHQLDIDTSLIRSTRPSRIFQYIIITLSILLGLGCLSGFIVTPIKWNLHSNSVNDCKNDTQSMGLCYIRLIISKAFQNDWDKFIIVSLLCTYASVFLHIITETNRTNVSGLLGLMIIQTMCIIFGIGVGFPILFLPAYIYFYKSNNTSNKSPVPIDILYIGLIYIICMITVPTYLIYFFPKDKLIVSIMAIILLVSPLGFALISLPFRLLSTYIQRCWFINSHRLIVYCQITLFIVSAPIYCFALVALIMHGSFDRIKDSYVTNITNVVNPMIIIWSIDYTSLFISLILFIIMNEYLFSRHNQRIQSLKLRKFIGYLFFAIFFIPAPCLVFPLYIAWREYQYIE